MPYRKNWVMIHKDKNDYDRNENKKIEFEEERCLNCKFWKHDFYPEERENILSSYCLKKHKIVTINEICKEYVVY